MQTNFNSLLENIKTNPIPLVKLGIKSAKANQNSFDERQIKNIRRAQKIAIELIRNDFFEYAFKVTYPLCNHLMGPNKNSAVQNICAEFFKYNQLDFVIKIGYILAPLKGKAKISLAADIAKRLIKQKKIKEATKIAALLAAQKEHFADQASASIFKTDDPTSKFFVKAFEFDIQQNKEKSIALAIKCARSNMNIYNPAQQRNITAAKDIALAFIKQDGYNEGLKIALNMCNASMGFLKSHAVIEIANTLLQKQKFKHVVKIATQLTPLKGRSKMFVLKSIGLTGIEINQPAITKKMIALLIQNQTEYATQMARDLKSGLQKERTSPNNAINSESRLDSSQLEPGIKDASSANVETIQQDFQEENMHLLFLDELKKTLSTITAEDPEASGYVLIPENPDPLESAYELVVTDTYLYCKIILTDTIYYIDFVTKLFYKDRQPQDPTTFIEEIQPTLLQIDKDTIDNNVFINALKKDKVA